MTHIALHFERCGRRLRDETHEIAVTDGLTDEVFLDALAEEVFRFARRHLASSEFMISTRFDEDSTHAGTFSIEADRFGKGRWELL